MIHDPDLRMCGALGGTRTPNLLIRSNGRTVQNYLLLATRWADLPALSACIGRWLPAWQQCWQQLSTCLQSAVSTWAKDAELGEGLPAGARGVPPLTMLNGTAAPCQP